MTLHRCGSAVEDVVVLGTGDAADEQVSASNQSPPSAAQARSKPLSKEVAQAERTLPWYGRTRWRAALTLLLIVVIAVAYVTGIWVYGRSQDPEFAIPDPPDKGVSVVLVPEAMDPEADHLRTGLVLVPSDSLLNEDGQLRRTVRVDIAGAIGDSSLVFLRGEVPASQVLELAIQGTVQDYPFDEYLLDVQVQASAADGEPLPALTGRYFKVPGWTYKANSPRQLAEDSVLDFSGTIERDLPTRSIALLLMFLMVLLAAIAVLLVWAVATRRIRKEIAVGSWTSLLLFALLPIRNYFPGAPPIGSWMDILVFFWVEAIIMCCVALVAFLVVTGGSRSTRPANLSDERPAKSRSDP